VGVTVYFLRHGQAGDREEWQGDDAKRPLTPDGKKRMEQEAAGLKTLKLPVTRILTSPLTRAQQTAKIVAAALDVPMAEDERLAPGFGTAALRGILREHRKATAVMLVGHEPDFSEMVSQITGGSQVMMKKGGLAAVEFEDPQTLHGTLACLLPPKVLESL